MTDARAHRPTHYHPEDFAPARRAMSWPAFIVVLSLLTGASMFGVGWLAFEEGRKYERAIAAALPKPAVHHAAPLTQWQCTKQEFAEYRHACARRALNALTPKEK